MGELVVSAAAGDELVAIGLGSCIGLALIDRAARVCGLAHIVLPSSTGANGPAPKFADTAVPEMIEQMCAAGARRDRLEAVYAGGARMFQVGAGSLDIGARNGEAVQEELAQVRIPVRATAIGGTRGRTVRVAVGHCTVTVQEAGGERDTMYDGRQPHVHRVSATLPPSLRVQPAGVRA